MISQQFLLKSRGSSGGVRGWRNGRLLRTPGLSTGGWTLVFEGEQDVLANLGLILTYRASAQ